MSGFQRPALQSTTFEPYNDFLKPTGGLRAAYENRLQSSTMSASRNVSDTTSSQSIYHIYSDPDQPISRSQNGNSDELLHLSSTEINPRYNDIRISDRDYPIGYHSIHRLTGLDNKQGGSNLKRAFEARMGGVARRTLKRSNKQDESLEKHANLIVSKMEQDEALMEDSPDAEELRKSALRDMPQCLTIKRCVKVKLSKSVSQKSKKKTLSCYRMFKYRASMAISKIKLKVKDLMYSFELWYDSLKKIEGNFGTGVASFFKLLRWLFLVNFIIGIVSLSFIVIPIISFDLGKIQPHDSIFIKDFITGEGYLTDTSMYYGHYTNETVSTIGTLTYSMSYAYFFTMAFIYLVSVIVIGASAAQSYRRSFIETEGGLKNIFANKIFCGWDYNIATQYAADLKSKAIYNELKELLYNYSWKQKQLSFYQKAEIRIIQFFMNILIFFLMAVMGYAIWQFLEKVSLERGTLIIITPIFINTVMTLLPMFFSFVVKYEYYKNPKITLLLTLARTFLLGAVTIGVLVFYWLKNRTDTACWETSLGQEIYRMIIFDFFISVICAALLDCLLYGIYKLRKDTHLEFDIAWNTMQIIYNQTLFWVGLVFSPILPVVVVIKLFITWYIRQFLVLLLCKPSSKTWRAAQTTTWFLILTFLSILGVGALLAYVISYVPLSHESCGPFRNHQYFFEVLTEGVFQLKSHSSVWNAILYLTKPGSIALVFIALCAAVYTIRAKANAQKEIVSHCRNMLVWSAKDKEYYYSLISQITNGQWQYNLSDKSLNPELHQPASNIIHEGGDINRDTSVSSYNFHPSSSISTIEPSLSSMSLDFRNGEQEYSRYKKNS